MGIPITSVRRGRSWRGQGGSDGESESVVIPELRGEESDELRLLLSGAAQKLDRPVSLRPNPFGGEMQRSQRGVVDRSVEERGGEFRGTVLHRTEIEEPLRLHHRLCERDQITIADSQHCFPGEVLIGVDVLVHGVLESNQRAEGREAMRYRPLLRRMGEGSKH
jgi:hypothetical protein